MEAVKNLIIDPEFQGKIPPLMEDEYKQLEENILSAGEVYTPIVTWNGIIVDGHNRWKVIQAHPEANIQYRTKAIPFKDKWDAFDWMYRNQLGRRNLTDEQRTYLIGKMYEARKHRLGGARGNQYTNLANPQNEDLPNKTARASQIIADEIGVSHATVERSEKFAKGIDAIRTQSPSTADDILTGKKKITQSDVQKIGTAKPEERDNLAKAVVEGKPLTIKNPEPAPVFNFDKPINTRSKEGRQLMERIRADVERQTDGKLEEITLSDFSEMLECDVQSMIERLTDVLSSKHIITKSIAKQTEASIKQLTKLKEVLNDVRIPA